ncbi:FadR/GntR family transcriptional regulator [Prauserella flavalba]|uniref:GntR family transcriptional regulator n=1 Tax=Prauserella flavalba TaxID=1477506 RepID=A0A318LAF4_9PSEU|nr:FCD domain-containing protein [Prauserella flavalba]PXY18445.1 GntR family transcriptional regulator [Prauserella flavalba]
MERDTDQQATTVRTFVQLPHIEVPKASDVLADTLRERILSGDFPEDTALPPERDLVTQAQMSRTTVREALRILEAQGFVRLKTGRAGGAFVRLPGEESVASTVSMFIKGRRIRMETLLETRETIEPMLAQLAARRRTDADLERIDAANAAMARSAGSLADFLQANVDWHVGVAEASHNELLVGLMSALSKAIYLSTENRSFVDENVRKATARAHEAVTQAIRDQDEAAAARRMSKHVHAYASAVKLVEDRVEIDVPAD